MPTQYIITNRKILNEYSQGNEKVNEDGKEEANDHLRFGKYSFDDLEDDGKEIVLYPESEPKEDEIENIVTNEEHSGATDLFKELYESMKNSKNGKGDTLVFIHGFKNKLSDSLDALRHLHYKYVEPKESPVSQIIMFTWPAMSSLLKYRDDARDAEISGYALGRSYQKLRDFLKKNFSVYPNKAFIDPCGKKTHLLCHSMGNRVLESMFVELINANVTLTTIFEEIILIAADVDYNALESPKPLNHIMDICNRTHIYYHKGDIALRISETTKNAFNRLGKFGPKQKNLLPDHVISCNVTETDKGFINHGYFYETPLVVEDIINVLNGKESKYIV